MDLIEFFHAVIGVCVHAGDEFELRLTEVGGDVWMCQRGTEPRRMGRLRQIAGLTDPQAFLFHTTLQRRHEGSGVRC